MSTRRILILAYPGVSLLDLVGPYEVFLVANLLLLGPADNPYTALDEPAHRVAYRVEVLSLGANPEVRSAFGLGLKGDALWSVRKRVTAQDTILVPGGDVRWALGSEPLLGWLRRSAGRVQRVASVCSGALILAQAGLLDGRRATTHWHACAELAARYPLVRVESDSIYVQDGSIVTSAGGTAGIDMALALLEQDKGRDLALGVARHMVMFLRRPGGQSQFSLALQAQATERQPLSEMLVWATENPAVNLSVEAMAEKAMMSPRTFARAFLREIGVTPACWVERMRVEAARRKLESSPEGLDSIALECGFGGTDSMRRAFLRTLRVLPRDYRKRFSLASCRSTDV